MLAFKHRFHGHSSLRYVYKNGDAVRSQYLTLKYSKNPHRKTSRYSVVVSKKIIKSAVGRNRIRRRVFEVLRMELPNLKSSYDVACIIASSELRDMAAGDLREIVVKALTEANLYK